MTLTSVEFKTAINSLLLSRDQLVEISTRITNHGLTVHPRLSDCSTCLPWLIEEQQLKNRIKSIEELLSPSNQ